MIIWHSIIFKIITCIENISEQFKTHILYSLMFSSETGTCDEIMWKVFSTRQERDYIIHLMRRMVLPCSVIKYTDTKKKRNL